MGAGAGPANMRGGGVVTRFTVVVVIGWDIALVVVSCGIEVVFCMFV